MSKKNNAGINVEYNNNKFSIEAITNAIIEKFKKVVCENNITGTDARVGVDE